MASVWKRLQRVNKRAAKFQYTASYHRIDLEVTPKWKPNKLSIVWTRRSRRVFTEPQEWEPSLKDPLKGSVIYTLPLNHTVAVTLFKDSRTNELEDKDWTFVLEDVSVTGKRRRIASCAINMRKFASLEPTSRTLKLQLEPATGKVRCAALHATLHCVLLREGRATDEDMQSLASLLSVNNNSDIAVLEDLDEDDYTLSDQSTRQMLDLRQQMEEMTQSLTNSDIAATPNSVQSLKFDSRTPTAPVSPTTPTKTATPTNEPEEDLEIVEAQKPKAAEDNIVQSPKATVPRVPSQGLRLLRFVTFKVPRKQYLESQDHSVQSLKLQCNSVQSLKFDSRTPTAPVSPTTPTTPATPTNEPEEELNIVEAQKPKAAEPPKFTSTPKSDELKGVVFKPKTIAKRNLKPLELKTPLSSINLDSNDNESGERTPTARPDRNDKDKTPPLELKTPLSCINLDSNDNESGERTPTARPDRNDKDKTPVQDLLEWCQVVTGEYKVCRVTNLTTSFRSGLAFCAIIHRFRPDLIDFSGLQPDDAERNLRVALEASGSLGLPRVLCAADVLSRPTPDRLAIMTYLFQLRAHFTGNELQVEQLGNDETESSYLVGRHDTDAALPRELFSREVSARRSRNTIDRPRPMSQESQPVSEPRVDPVPEQPASPAAKEVRDMLVASRTLLGKVLSPARELAKPTAKWFAEPIGRVDTTKHIEPPPARPEKLMTRKELTDPFGSDDEDEPPPPATTQIPHETQATNHDNTDAIKSEQKPPTIEPALTDPLTTPEKPDTPPESAPESAPDARPPKPPSPELPKPTPQLLSRHDELKERARQLLEATKREAREKDRLRRQASKEKEEREALKENGIRNGELSPVKKPMTEEERQAMLRERARKLIADARAGIVSPTSPLSPSRNRGPTLEIISKQSLMDEIAAAGGVEQLDAMLARTTNGSGPDSTHSSPGSRNSSGSPDRSEERGSSGGSADGKRSPLQSFSAFMERLTPDKEPDESRETGSYIQSELEALEREQKAIDERAAALEKQLRRVMESADNTEEEDRLMSQWFNLVNKKNALLRRQMQLNILEQEEDLSRRCELLARELRLSLGVDEWRKTPGQKRRERLLLQELLSAVNERDRLVQEMDEQEKAIADDETIERNLSQVEIQRKNNCILQ